MEGEERSRWQEQKMRIVTMKSDNNATVQKHVNTRICLLRLNAIDETGTGITHENE